MYYFSSDFFRYCSMAKILIVDDDPHICKVFIEYLEEIGHHPTAVHTLFDGLGNVADTNWDVVLLDVLLPDGNGLEYLSRFIEAPSAPEVIIITGRGDQDGAEKTILRGGWSYIEKPDVLKDLSLHLARAIQYRVEKKTIKQRPVALKRSNIIGSSRVMNDCFDMIARASSCDVNVLITGETGTGKELFARAIHENSNYAAGNFVVIDCASLPENLIESTLFGHEKGAFTGADIKRDGLIKSAHNGTLFLDEVGELPLNVQVRFLRVLQERSYRPVGATREIKSDFRLVAATNRDLNENVKNDLFRDDLLFRLQGFSIELPPLKKRLDDIRALVTYRITGLCDQYDLETKGVAPDFIEALASYEWPGNVRELYQIIDQVFANFIQSQTLFAIHLPEKIRICQARASVKSMQKIDYPTKKPDTFLSWRSYKNKFEELYLRDLMSLSKNNIQAASKASGISRTRLYQMLYKHDLHPSNSLNKIVK